MRKITLAGRVLPELRKVSTPKINRIFFDDPRGFKADVDIDITNGRVRIDFEIHLEIANCEQFCMARAHEFATIAVDIFAFSKGWALSVIIDEMIESNTIRPVAISEEKVQNHGQIFKNDSEFQDIIKIVFDNFNLKFAFHDLISSLNTLNYSAIAACRAIETIRDLISPGLPEAQAWKKMRKELRIERSYLQAITDASRGPRHGDRGSTDGTTQMVVTTRAWEIMNRYIQYMMRGTQSPLPEKEFSILSDHKQ